MNSYTFSVTNISEIDLNRIVKEQYEAGHLITLISNRKQPVGILIHQNYLNPFEIEDNLILCGKELYNKTGYGTIFIQYKNREFFFTDSCHYQDNLKKVELENARLILLNEENITIEKIKKEIEKIEKFVRRIEVRVDSIL